MWRTQPVNPYLNVLKSKWIENPFKSHLKQKAREFLRQHSQSLSSMGSPPPMGLLGSLGGMGLGGMGLGGMGLGGMGLGMGMGMDELGGFPFGGGFPGLGSFPMSSGPWLRRRRRRSVSLRLPSSPPTLRLGPFLAALIPSAQLS